MNGLTGSFGSSIICGSTFCGTITGTITALPPIQNLENISPKQYVSTYESALNFHDYKYIVKGLRQHFDLELNRRQVILSKETSVRERTLERISQSR